MSTPATLSWEGLHELFTVVMCIDKSMKIVYASDTLGEKMPETLRGPLLSDVFSCLRPVPLETFSQGVRAAGSLCLLVAKSEKFAIRGQLLKIEYEGRDTLCFCGSPWLYWINAQVSAPQLGLSDFSAQDVQLDQLFFMSTEKKMVEDLENLNCDLKIAKQRMEEARNAKERFFAQMSHEIRTPLNGVVSALSLMEQLEDSDEPSDFLRLAQSSSENLMQVVNYVLSVSKLELSQNLEKTNFDLPDFVCSTIDVVRAKAQQKSLAVDLELSSQLPRFVSGAPELLRQSLLNLLINAIKFTNEGGISLRLTLNERAGEQHVVRFEVTDSGLGIAQEHLGQIFDPFWSSVSEGVAPQEQGTGLGLDIVRRNVCSMGGEIHVQSVLGGGTTFTFDLPFEAVDPPAITAATEKSVPALAGKVLLVDDNETNRVLGALILETLGLEVVTADGGCAAVATVRDAQFDLVLMDISMPDIDGLEATRQIRKLNAVPPVIVALTAYVDADEKAACLEVGMADYLTKPIVRDDLASVLATWLASDEATNLDQTGTFLSNDSKFTGNAVSKPAIEDLIDRKVLHELLIQVGQDNVRTIIKKVKAEALQRWQELEKAESLADKALIRLHVHSLSSIYRSVGLFVIGDELTNIEICLRAGDTPKSGWLEDMQRLRIDSHKALDERLSAL